MEIREKVSLKIKMEYIAIDGKVFTDKQACINYEEYLEDRPKQKLLYDFLERIKGGCYGKKIDSSYTEIAWEFYQGLFTEHKLNYGRVIGEIIHIIVLTQDEFDAIMLIVDKMKFPIWFWGEPYGAFMIGNIYKENFIGTLKNWLEYSKERTLETF